MALNHYVTLGKSGLRVSPLCLGTMTFGTQWGWGSDDDISSQILDLYLEKGGNFLDTANIYTKGYSEKFIGDYFSKQKGAASNNPRDRVVIATKFMGNMYRGDPNGGGANRKSIISACEQSLRRLNTDYIDLYYAHFWDQNTPLEEMVRAMEDLVRSGKVRYLGISDHPAWICAHAQHLLKEIGGNPFIALQIEYSLAQRTVEAELIPMAKHFGMGVTPWSPLRGGVLTGKYRRDSKPGDDVRLADGDRHLNEKNFQIVDELVAIAEELSGSREVSAAEVAIAWVVKQSGVSSTIIGARKLSQIESNLGALELKLTEDHLSRLDKVSSVTHPFPFDFVEYVKATIAGGTCVNGQAFEPWPLSPEGDSDRI